MGSNKTEKVGISYKLKLLWHLHQINLPQHRKYKQYSSHYITPLPRHCHNCYAISLLLATVVLPQQCRWLGSPFISSHSDMPTLLQRTSLCHSQPMCIATNHKEMWKKLGSSYKRFKLTYQYGD